MGILMMLLFTVFIFAPLLGMVISNSGTTYIGHMGYGLCMLATIPILFGIFKGLIWMFLLIGNIFVGAPDIGCIENLHQVGDGVYEIVPSSVSYGGYYDTEDEVEILD